MAVTKRTISLPVELAKRVEQIAKMERESFSGAIAVLLEDALARRRTFRSWGAGDSGLGDLSIRLEEYLRETPHEDES